MNLKMNNARELKRIYRYMKKIIYILIAFYIGFEIARNIWGIYDDKMSKSFSCKNGNSYTLTLYQNGRLQSIKCN